MDPEVLNAGDRFPNVMVADSAGQRSLYNRHRGGPVLIVWGAPLAAVPATAGWWLLALDAGAGACHIEANQALHDLVAGARTAGALLLDQAMRVWLRIDATGSDDLLAQLARLSPPLAPISQGLLGSAPVLVLPRVLEPALCAEVIAHYRAHGGLPSGVLQYQAGQPQFTLDAAVKMRRETVITDPALEARVHQRVMQRVLPEMARAFAFEVHSREHFKIIAYQAGAGYFRAHRDNDTADVAYRRFAMTLNLNTGEYQGGCLRFPEFGPHVYEAEAGGACIFSCSLLHEATDVTAGERLAMTSFLY